MTHTPRPQLAALTSARFFAAFHVFLFHMGVLKGLSHAPAWLQKFASVGYVAITFFFVLSGFILVYTYAGKDFSLRRFWKARLARLYPVYLLSLMLTAPFFFYAVLKINVPELAWFKTHLASTLVLVLTMLQAWVPQAVLGWNGVAWAVSVEIFFYVLFPVLLARFSRISNQGLATIGLACWMLALATALAYVVLSPDHIVADASYDDRSWLNALKFNPLVRLPEFVVGMACGYWFVREDSNPKLATPLVLGGTAVALVTTAFSHLIPYPVMHTGLYAPAFAAIIGGLALRPRWTSFLEFRWLLLLGESSYAFYLLHVMVLGMFLFPITPQSPTPRDLNSFVPLATPGRLIGAAVTTTVVAVLVFRFVEEPARKWLRGKPRPHAAPTPTSA
jgi:peptidoglycan/LPS O-acetylase OafA/YrhL